MWKMWWGVRTGEREKGRGVMVILSLVNDDVGIWPARSPTFTGTEHLSEQQKKPRTAHSGPRCDANRAPKPKMTRVPTP